MTVRGATEILESYAYPSLQQMARQRGLPLKNQSKPTLVAALAPDLFDPDRIHAARSDLEPVERQVLEAILRFGGSVSTGVLRGQLLAQGVVTEPAATAAWPNQEDGSGSPTARGSTKFADVIARLGVLGLVFTSGPPSSGAIVELSQPGRELFVPEPILAVLPKPVLAGQTVPQPMEVQPGDPADFRRDLYELIRFVDSERIPLTARGQIAKRVLVRLDQSFQVPEGTTDVRAEDELPRLTLLRALAEDARLLVARTGVLFLGDQAQAFLALPSAERTRVLFDRYRQTTRWNELLNLPGVKVTAKGGIERETPTEVVEARQRVLAELARLPTNQWIAVEHLIDRLKDAAYEFLFPRGTAFDYRYRYYAPYATNPYLGGNLLGWTFTGAGNEAQGWDRVEGGLIRRVVDALHWLGGLDLGGATGAASAFRVNPLGAALLRGEALPVELREPNVVVQPNFQLFAFEPTGEDVLFRLDRIAERVRTERAVEYRLTKESLYRAQQRGQSSQEVIAFLEEVSRTPLPQNVRVTLEEWGSLHERVVLRRGVAVLQADPATLDALAANPEVGRLLGRRIAPTAVLVSPGDLLALDEALRLADHFPARDEGAEGTSGPAVTVDSTGRIAFLQRQPSIFVRRELRAFAEARPDGTFQLTRASLRDAARAGQSREAILAVLQRNHAGPLPSSVQEMIERLAKDWGNGALAEAIVLQVESPEILAEVLADPALSRELAPLPGAPTIALVRPEAVARVRSALIDRGMTLGDRFR